MKLKPLLNLRVREESMELILRVIVGAITTSALLGVSSRILVDAVARLVGTVGWVTRVDKHSRRSQAMLPPIHF